MAGEVGRAQTVHGCGPYSGLWSLPGNYRHPLKDFKQENGMTGLKFQSNHLGCEQKQTGRNRSEASISFGQSQQDLCQKTLTIS